MPRATRLPERLRIGDGSADRHRQLLPLLQPGTPPPESRLSNTGGALREPDVNGMTRANKEEPVANSGTLSPNPWDLSLSRQNGCLKLEALERRIGLRRDAPRAPIQGPEWQRAASMPRPSHSQNQTRRTLANRRPKMVLTMGSTLQKARLSWIQPNRSGNSGRYFMV